jgi:signal peptidase I
MMPTFLTYDFLLVDKISYGIHLPVLNTELVDIGDPQRGDVVVFTP